MDNTDADILETFKAAALSVTRLYKTSAAAATKARSDGYQECLEDLLSFLDKNKLASDGAAGAAIRQWATERQDGRELPHNSTDSDDDADKPADPPSSPVMNRPQPTLRQQSSSDVHMQTTESTALARVPTPTTAPASAALPPFREPIAVPTRDTFTFQAAVPYPQVQQAGGDYPNLANLELSDNQQAGRTSSPAILKSRMRATNDNRTRSGRGSHVSRLAGQKRRIDFNELFDLQSIGKDGFPFGGGGKRPRHN